jgi:hypothetical protein
MLLRAVGTGGFVFPFRWADTLSLTVDRTLIIAPASRPASAVCEYGGYISSSEEQRSGRGVESICPGDEYTLLHARPVALCNTGVEIILVAPALLRQGEH